MDAPATPATALLLLAELPPAVAAAANRARASLAPGRAAHMPAHCTLVRHLPGPSASQLVADVRRLVRASAPPALTIGPPRQKERAILLPIRSPELLETRAMLAQWWAPMVLPHERGEPQLHITLAAGLDPPAARPLLVEAGRLLAKAPFIGQRLACPALILVPHQPRGAAPLLRAAFRG